MEELTHLILKHSCTHYLNILDSVLPFQNWHNNFWEDLYKISEVQAKGLMLSKDSGESHFQQIWHKSGLHCHQLIDQNSRLATVFLDVWHLNTVSLV